ncbi:hypothetical protein BGX26_005199, partial [Mortierella sp. AD094]
MDPVVDVDMDVAVAVIGAPIRLRDTSENQSPLSVLNGVTIDGNLKATGRISTDEYVPVNGIANQDAECSPTGLIEQDRDGRILTCQAGLWRKRRIHTTVREHTNEGYRWPASYVQCADHERVTGGG